ncbi:MAG: patatin-like phospholipase family protein [Deltaproteobacteria bacterium]|nr:patatin-like phospholipase family protein [Deltaproteobacteria bacterium]
MNAVFLSGGGARGAYEVGVLRALMKDGPPIKLIGGASVGAINAVLAATGQLDELAEVWQNMSTFKVYRPRLDVWKLRTWTSLFDNRALFKRLRDEVHWARLPHSPLQVVISATNITLRTNEIFTSSDITYRHVLASSAIPILFPPVRIGKHWYIDGAFSLLRPLKPLLNAGADRIFTVFLSPRRPRLRPPSNLFQLADRVLEVILSSSISADRKQIDNTNQEIERLVSLGIDPDTFRHKPYRPVKVIAIYPSRDLGNVGSYLIVSGDKAKELMELGMTDCYRVLKRHNLI